MGRHADHCYHKTSQKPGSGVMEMICCSVMGELSRGVVVVVVVRAVRLILVMIALFVMSLGATEEQTDS